MRWVDSQHTYGPVTGILVWVEKWSGWTSFTGKNGPARPIFSWKNGPGLKILVRPSTFGRRGA